MDVPQWWPLDTDARAEALHHINVDVDASFRRIYTFETDGPADVKIGYERLFSLRIGGLTAAMAITGRVVGVSRTDQGVVVRWRAMV